MGLRTNILAGIVAAALPPISLAIAVPSVNDNAAPGTLITAVNVAAGYTLALEDTYDGCFALSGNNLVTGATDLWSGWAQPTLSVYKAGQRNTRRAIKPYILVNASVQPSDVAGLTHAWRADSSVTATGADVDSIQGAWGTSVVATGSSSGGAPQKPQLVIGGGPLGIKNMITFSGTGRSRLTFPTTGAMATGTAFIVYRQGNVAGQMATFASVNNLNYISMPSSANPWTVQVNAKAAGGTEIVTGFNAGGMFDQRAIGIMIFTWDGANQTVYINGNQGGTTANTGAFTFDQFGGLNSSFNLTADFMACGLYAGKVISAAERKLLERALISYTSRDIFFSAAGADAALGNSGAVPKLTLDTFALGASGFKTGLGTRLLMRAGDTQKVNSVFLWKQGSAYAGCRIRLGTYDPTTYRPPNTGVWRTPSQGAAPNLAKKAILTVSTRYTTGWTNNGDGTWTRAPGYTPVWVSVLGSGRYRVLQSRATTVGNDNSWAFAAGNLTIRLQGIEDANSGMTIDAAPNIQCFGVSQNNTEVDDLLVTGTGNGGFECTGPMKNCCVMGASGDAFTPGSSLHSCESYDVGPGVAAAFANLASTNYDASTVHGGTTVQWGLTEDNCFWHGFANFSDANTTINDLRQYAVGISYYEVVNGADNGVVVINRSTFSKRGDSGVDTGITYAASAGAGGGTLTINDTHIIAEGTFRPGSKAILTPSVVPTLTNVTQSNYASLQ